MKEMICQMTKFVYIYTTQTLPDFY